MGDALAEQTAEETGVAITGVSTAACGFSPRGEAAGGSALMGTTRLGKVTTSEGAAITGVVTHAGEARAATGVGVLEGGALTGLTAVERRAVAITGYTARAERTEQAAGRGAVTGSPKAGAAAAEGLAAVTGAAAAVVGQVEGGGEDELSGAAAEVVPRGSPVAEGEVDVGTC
jgi:hypothetical protein